MSCVDTCRSSVTTAQRIGCASQAQNLVTCNFEHPCMGSTACTAQSALAIACIADYCNRNPSDPACM